MPRSLLSRRRHRRRKPGRFVLHKPVWRDPYPWIPGTEPEKRLFDALIKYQRFFVFQDALPELKQLRDFGFATPKFVPDFVIPQYRVILDPYGDYHHTLPDAVQSDAVKAALYTALGYTFVHPWASEVESKGGLAILYSIPELQGAPRYPLSEADRPYLAQGYRLGPYVGLGSTSVAAANRRRRRARSVTIRVRR